MRSAHHNVPGTVASAVGQPASQVRRLSLYALAGTGLFTVIVLLLHFVRPEYDPVTRFISEYAVTDPVVAGLAFVALALGSMALLRALDLSLSAEARSRAGTLLLWIYAVCFFAVGFFPTDEFPTVNPPSWHGIIHAILGLISFACFSAGSLLVSLRLRREPAWQNTAPALTALSALCVASFFVFYGGLEEVMGLIERIYAALIVAWLALAAAKLRAGASETAAAADSRGPSADR